MSDTDTPWTLDRAFYDSTRWFSYHPDRVAPEAERALEWWGRVGKRYAQLTGDTLTSLFRLERFGPRSV